MRFFVSGPMSRTVNGLRFIQRFSSQWPLESALQYGLTFTRSCTHSHTDGDSQLVRSSEGEGEGVSLRDTATL